MSEIPRTYACGRFVVTELPFEDGAEQFRAPVAPPARPAIDPRSPEALKQLYFAFRRRKRATELAARRVAYGASAPGALPLTLPQPMAARLAQNTGPAAGSAILAPVVRCVVPADILQRLAAANALDNETDDA